MDADELGAGRSGHSANTRSNRHSQRRLRSTVSTYARNTIEYNDFIRYLS